MDHALAFDMEQFYHMCLLSAVVEEEQKLVSAEKYVPLLAMEDSPILGIISKATSEPSINSTEGASTEDGEIGKWSLVLEIDDEINSASEEGSSCR